jgi:hypothetical protein
MDFVATDSAPKAIGPYSQAVKANGLVYTSGQIALDPASGNLVTDSFEAQARRAVQAPLHEPRILLHQPLLQQQHRNDVGGFADGQHRVRADARLEPRDRGVRFASSPVRGVERAADIRRGASEIQGRRKLERR